MNEIIKQYQQDLLCVFAAKDTVNQRKLIVVKDGTVIEYNKNYDIRKYSEDFESLLNFKIPTKNRKQKQLISYQACRELLQEIDYGVLSFTYEEVPYSVGLNHVILDDKIYFHAAKTGFKLNGTHVPVSYLVIKDLGVNEDKSTHNHASVFLQGNLELVEDVSTKMQVLTELMRKLAPTNHRPITEQMAGATGVLCLDVKFMIGKSHIR